MPGERIERLFFPYLARGMSLSMPPRSMTGESQGPLWREALNVRTHDGMIRRRAIVLNRLSYPTIDLNTENDVANSKYGNHQTPMVVKSYQEGEFALVVTNREIHWYNDALGDWVNLTPIFTQDTTAGGSRQIDVVNASTAVEVNGTPGSGELWSTRELGPSMMLWVDPDTNNWGPYSIESIDSEEELTLASNFLGTTGTYDYVIRRTFNSPTVDYPIFAEVINGDLYVAGPVGGGNGAIGAIIQVPDVLSAAVEAADAIYLTASEEIAKDLDYLPELLEILGMEFLGDGRVVIAAWSNAGGTDIRNRIYFSSHLDKLVWNLSPAGFSDRTELGGRLVALGKFGKSITVHFPNGIIFGHPTGQDDPPLAWQQVPLVFQGCTATRTLRSTPRGEMFIGKDHQVLLFDGASVTPIGDDIKQVIAEDWGYDSAAHAALDFHRKEYSLFFPDLPAAGQTEELVFNWETQQWTRLRHTHQLGAVSDVLRSLTTPSWTGRGDGVAIIGYASWDSDLGQTMMLYAKVEDGIRPPVDDTFVPNCGVEDGIELVTGDLDAGLPGYNKVWRKVTLWVGNGILSDAIPSSPEDYKVALSVDRGDTWAQEVTVGITRDAATTDTERILHFWFTPLMGETVRIRIRVTDGPEFHGELNRMTIDYQLAGDVESYAGNPA